MSKHKKSSACHHDRTARVIDRLGPMLDVNQDGAPRANVLEEHWFCLDCGVTTDTKTYDRKG